jgi:hypothetical protein
MRGTTTLLHGPYTERPLFLGEDVRLLRNNKGVGKHVPHTCYAVNGIKRLHFPSSQGAVFFGHCQWVAKIV